MSNREEILSDLDQARILSQSLSGGGGIAPIIDEDEDRFISFSAASLQGRLTPPPPPSDLELDTAGPLTTELLRFDTWEELLDWCLELFPAQAAFVVGPEGFVIANRGGWELAQLEGIGPQMLTLSERARELEESGHIRFLAFQLESFWLAGLCTRHEEMGDFILGFAGAQLMSSNLRAAIFSQLQHNLHHL
jgi:hypothetical protein